MNVPTTWHWDNTSGFLIVKFCSFHNFLFSSFFSFQNLLILTGLKIIKNFLEFINFPLGERLHPVQETLSHNCLLIWVDSDSVKVAGVQMEQLGRIQCRDILFTWAVTADLYPLPSKPRLQKSSNWYLSTLTYMLSCMRLAFAPGQKYSLVTKYIYFNSPFEIRSRALYQSCQGVQP